jgi:hypothetical protein
MSALERLKLIQQQFKQTWVGIDTEYTDRPGTSNMCNQERKFKVPKPYLEEVERERQFQIVFDTLRNIENDFPLLISSANDRQARTQQNFFSKANKNLEQGVNNISSYVHDTAQ